MSIVKRLTRFALPCAAAACFAVPAFGSLATLDENTPNTFGFGTLDTAAYPGAVVIGPTSVTFDAQNVDPLGWGAFGGWGADIPQVDFDPYAADLEVRIKVLENNAQQFFTVVLRDNDGALGTPEYHYQFDISGLTPGDGFVVMTKNLISNIGWIDDPSIDNVFNPGLDRILVESVLGSPDRMHVEMDYVKVVPEPSTLMVGSLMGASALIRRRWL